ncbi:MAG: alpha-galactosidase [Clostridia bacterium]|nr:alpha-galactosidase [Clostridia bacterium]
MILDFSKNGLYLVFEVDEKERLLLKHFSCKKQDPELVKSGTPFAVGDVHVTGEDQDDHHGGKHTGHSGTRSLRYVSHKIVECNGCETIEFLMTDGRMNVTAYYQIFDGVAGVRSWTKVENISQEPLGLEYVPSFSYVGINEGKLPNEESIRVYIPHSSANRDVDWQETSLMQLGYDRRLAGSCKRITVSNSGTWSAKDHLPMGVISNVEAANTFYFQIENNGSWQWEIGDQGVHIYLKLSGPCERENHWNKELKPGESFEGVKAAVMVGADFDEALAEMTKYRRKIIHNNPENAAMPVIFNDYMNCLGARPTEENEPPIIDLAAEAGAEYYCMDAGWYADGNWWDTVGEWQPSAGRFPHGIHRIFDYVREKGMVPGIWLEIEVMGVNCPLAKQWPDECFFMRHGKRVIDHGRYQLDFRHPMVRAHADATIDRVINEYGVGYIKMDYNIDAGVGTEVDADSFGDGLLEHNRAYLDWIRNVLKRHPSLILECCSSGGMRMDYAMLSVGHLQSVSDQTNYLVNAILAAGAPTAVLPEQGAIWSYPKEQFSDDGVVVNMVNSMLQRIHLSGKIWDQTESGMELIKEGVACYKTYRHEIPTSIPFYPLGLPTYGADFMCLAFKCDSGVRMAVWRMNTEKKTVIIPVASEKGVAKVIYPKKNECVLSATKDTLTVTLKNPNSAVLIELA